MHRRRDYATVVAKGSQRSNNMGENTVDFDLGSITASIWVEARGGQRVQAVDMHTMETTIQTAAIFKQRTTAEAGTQERRDGRGGERGESGSWRLDG